MYDRRTGLIAAAFGAIAPILIWYSDEARMYSLLLLLGVITVWAHYQAVQTFKLRYWLIYPVAAAAMVWTHYFAALPVATLQLVLLFQLRGKTEEERWKRLLAFFGTTAAIVALLAPLAPFALDQFVTNQEAGKGLDQPQRAGGAIEGHEISPYAALSNVIWAVWGYHSPGTMVGLVAMWPLLVLAAFLALGRRPGTATKLLVTVAVLPAIALTALAFFQPFIFELRFNLTAVPMIMLLGARVASAVPVSRAGRFALVGAVSATLLAGAADQQFNGANPRLYDFKGALGEVNERAQPGDVILYQPYFLNNVIEYYSPDIEARNGSAPQPGELQTAPEIFVLRSFSDDPAAVRATDATLATLRQSRTQVERIDKSQVKVWVFR
jgi:uncharacterized membrane protein